MYYFIWRGRLNLNQDATYNDIKRIVQSKLIDKTDKTPYEDLSEFIFGEGNCFNESEVRKRIYGMKRLIEIIDKERINVISDDSLLDEIAEKTQELQKERYKFFDYRNSYNKLLRERSRQEELNEIIVETVNSETLPYLEYSPSYDVDYNNNTLLVSLNDLHLGANINNSFNVYNSDVCRERLCKYLDRIKDIATTHKSRECVVWCNGDMISGNIHTTIQITNKENVVEQVIAVSELVSEFMAELSKWFNTVRFVSVAGNHSRLGKKDDSLKDERLDDLVEWYAKARLQAFENVIFDDYEKIDSTMYLINVQGLNYIGVHGDYDNSVGKIQAMQMMIKRDIYAVLLGHKHRNEIGNIQGVKTIMAGSFQGVDDYCIQKRIFGNPEQLVSVADGSGIVCHYDVQL